MKLFKKIFVNIGRISFFRCIIARRISPSALFSAFLLESFHQLISCFSPTPKIFWIEFR